jgi:hypothetical protein
MTTEPSDPPSSKRVLEPIERISEVLFGLIMVLTFTGSFKVGSGDATAVRKMLLSALGCNLVWGIIDGIMYLMGCLAEKARGLAAVRAVRAADPVRAQRIIAAALPPLVASLLKPPEFEAMRQELSRMPEFPARPRLHLRDWVGAAGVCLLVFVSTFPVVLPFVFMQNALAALRVSNAIALVMLFIAGYAFALCTGFRGWVMGLGMMVVGVVLAGLAMAVGG